MKGFHVSAGVYVYIPEQKCLLSVRDRSSIRGINPDWTEISHACKIVIQNEHINYAFLTDLQTCFLKVEYDRDGVSFLAELDDGSYQYCYNGYSHYIGDSEYMRDIMGQYGQFNLWWNFFDKNAAPTGLNKQCTHKWVEMGFVHSKIVCKHCNLDMK